MRRTRHPRNGAVTILLPNDRMVGHYEIPRGAGLVGHLATDGSLHAWHAARSSFDEPTTWGTRVAEAVDRMFGRTAPSFGTTVEDWSQVSVIGWWDLARGEARLDGRAAETRLAAWLGTITLDPAQLVSEDVGDRVRRAFLAACAAGDQVAAAKARDRAILKEIDLPDPIGLVVIPRR